MAQTSFPFDNQDTQEIQFTHWAREQQDNGVVESSTSNALDVSADSTGMYVDVQPGNAWVQGFFYQSTAVERLPIESGAATRYDWIVLRLDIDTDSIVLAVAKDKGLDESLLAQSSDGVYELPLARVTVTGGTLVIADADVADWRHWVSGRVGVWTTNTRPRGPRPYTLGRNTTLDIFEFWDGTDWTELKPSTYDALAQHYGVGTAFPTGAIQEGALYRHTGLACTMRRVGNAWRQAEDSIVANDAARIAISTDYSAFLYDGFHVWQADIDADYVWTGSVWKAPVPAPPLITYVTADKSLTTTQLTNNVPFLSIAGIAPGTWLLESDGVITGTSGTIKFTVPTGTATGIVNGAAWQGGSSNNAFTSANVAIPGGAGLNVGNAGNYRTHGYITVTAAAQLDLTMASSYTMIMRAGSSMRLTKVA